MQDQFTKSIQMKDGRYQVSLPWREHHKPLPTNQKLSLKLLYGLLCRIKQDPEVLLEYDAIIREQLEKGIATEKVHYLPHLAVIWRDKDTTKVRVAYDASRPIGPSLNSCLHTEPKFNQKILEILLHFLSYPITRRGHRESLFNDLSRPIGSRCIAFPVGKGCPCGNYPTEICELYSGCLLLNATTDHVKQYIEAQSDLVEKLIQSVYLRHDVVSGADDEEAYVFYQGSKEMLLDGSFNLRKCDKLHFLAGEDRSKGGQDPVKAYSQFEFPPKSSHLTKVMWSPPCRLQLSLPMGSREF